MLKSLGSWIVQLVLKIQIFADFGIVVGAVEVVGVVEAVGVVVNFVECVVGDFELVAVVVDG